jgi:hypothetical protein
MTGVNTGLAEAAFEGVRSARRRVGATDGVGYEVMDVRPGRGFSYRETAVKEMGNGRRVERIAEYPGPFDGVAGLSTTITERFRVCVGWEPFDEVLSEVDPMPLPKGASKWINPDLCDDSIWFAEFEDQDAAEVFALSLGVDAEACKGIPRLTRQAGRA